MIVEKILSECILKGGNKFDYDHLYCFDLVVRNPLDKNDQFSYTFGFALSKNNPVNNSEELLLFRIQNHLRGMQLGRRTLRKLLGDPFNIKNWEMDECIIEKLIEIDPSEDPTAFDRLYDSVINEFGNEERGENQS